MCIRDRNSFLESIKVLALCVKHLQKSGINTDEQFAILNTWSLALGILNLPLSTGLQIILYIFIHFHRKVQKHLELPVKFTLILRKGLSWLRYVTFSFMKKILFCFVLYLLKYWLHKNQSFYCYNPWWKILNTELNTKEERNIFTCLWLRIAKVGNC